MEACSAPMHSIVNREKQFLKKCFPLSCMLQGAFCKHLSSEEPLCIPISWYRHSHFLKWTTAGCQVVLANSWVMDSTQAFSGAPILHGDCCTTQGRICCFVRPSYSTTGQCTSTFTCSNLSGHHWQSRSVLLCFVRKQTGCAFCNRIDAVICVSCVHATRIAHPRVICSPTFVLVEMLLMPSQWCDDFSSEVNVPCSNHSWHCKRHFLSIQQIAARPIQESRKPVFSFGMDCIPFSLSEHTADCHNANACTEKENLVL